LLKKKGSYSAFSKQLRDKLLCLKFNLEAGHNSTGRLHGENCISLGHKHLALGNRVAEKEEQMSSWQMPFWAIVFLGKCRSGQMSSGQVSFWANVVFANVFLGKCLFGQRTFWAKVFLGKCFWANVFWANDFMGKCLSGQMLYGQMSSGQMTLWANVFLGKCRMGKRHRTVVEILVYSSSVGALSSRV
jgi:hypothetical protein